MSIVKIKPVEYTVVAQFRFDNSKPIIIEYPLAQVGSADAAFMARDDFRVNGVLDKADIAEIGKIIAMIDRTYEKGVSCDFAVRVLPPRDYL